MENNINKIKEFNELSTEEANILIAKLVLTPKEELTDVEKHILKFNAIKPAPIVEEYFIEF